MKDEEIYKGLNKLNGVIGQIKNLTKLKYNDLKVKQTEENINRVLHTIFPNDESFKKQHEIQLNTICVRNPMVWQKGFEDGIPVMIDYLENAKELLMDEIIDKAEFDRRFLGDDDSIEEVQ